MGILNLTPDSFHDGGAWDKPSAALGQAERMLDEGADVLDLGAQSTRPGAEVLGAEAEWQRLEPVLVALQRDHPDAILSVDTFHAEVARRALAEGADIINDVSGGDADPDMWKVVAQARAPYVLMHMQGTPATMQDNPTYDDVVHEVVTHLQRRVHAAYQAGVADVIADVGFGFGKTVKHNYALLDALDQFQELAVPHPGRGEPQVDDPKGAGHQQPARAERHNRLARLGAGSRGAPPAGARRGRSEGGRGLAPRPGPIPHP